MSPLNYSYSRGHLTAMLKNFKLYSIKKRVYSLVQPYIEIFETLH